MALSFKNARSLAVIAGSLVGAAAAAAAVLARFAAVHSSIAALSSSVSRLWSSVRFLLVPPYLFITVHLIIAAIWKLSDQKIRKSPNDTPADVTKPSDRNVTPLKVASAEIPLESEAVTQISAAKSVRSCVTTDSDENPAVSSRFESLESKVGEGEEVETVEGLDLEDTWQTIVMKKSATWDRSTEHAEVAPEAAGDEVARRSVTFGESSSADGNDELNRRFEAFIKKNYDQIRSY